MDYDLDSTLSNMLKLNTEGVLMPHFWHKTNTFENGKPNLLGTMILAWIEHGEKFKTNKLEKDYGAFGEELGVTTRQVKDPVKPLEKKFFIVKQGND